MDIGESIAVAIITDAPSSPCWYCEEPGYPNRNNDEDADPDTSDGEDADSVPENDLHNDASKLGGNIQNKPSWAIKCPDKGSITTVISAAHHCIPGNASFKKATTLLRYVRKGGPLSLASDIGYGINHQNNGVWLPGNYAVRAGSNNYTKGWSSQTSTFKDEYAKRAMNKARVQFHDAHTTYSDNVRKTLESIAAKIGKPAEKCPVCGKKFDKCRPPYGLVGRLDSVSQKHRSMISTLSKKRGKNFVSAGYYTSSRVKTYFKIV